MIREHPLDLLLQRLVRAAFRVTRVQDWSSGRGSKKERRETRLQIGQPVWFAGDAWGARVQSGTVILATRTVFDAPPDSRLTIPVFRPASTSRGLVISDR